MFGEREPRHQPRHWYSYRELSLLLLPELTFIQVRLFLPSFPLFLKSPRTEMSNGFFSVAPALGKVLTLPGSPICWESLTSPLVISSVMSLLRRVRLPLRSLWAFNFLILIFELYFADYNDKINNLEKKKPNVYLNG